MTLIHRKIDFEHDKDYVLERHCRINYACDSPWKRKMAYTDYQAEWFSLQGQVEAFYSDLQASVEQPYTIAEILETGNGETVGYFWAPFVVDEESGFCFADIQDVYIEKAYRKRGIASALMEYAENAARQHGASVIRSGTGCENFSSIALHKKLGFSPYRYEFEKVL